MLHSIRCPAIAAQTIGGFTLVYSGDIVAFEIRRRPAGAVSTSAMARQLTGSLVGGTPGRLIGHTTVRAQLGWLSRYGIPRAIFSHFGKQPIEMGDGALEEALTKLATSPPPGCAVTSATDGLELEIGV